ncbi:MAG: gliding motility-associated C-terminal domain-containing protein [Haliscomenobacter sp.]|uniref:T9SS type B sorting domain-containing protein n=1 Tax=Haliscomenobacter sp. TaxID=2717303 RepID=UPI0029A48D88|nr:gliding motility-associated C-terminal domain-containing protein [Haliscomenobacter sp.]MDX2072033.1 gliding motility-associated C-terminal domain-containing protein [Haliscomenobacter sp.]
MGYNVVDQFLYALDFDSYELLRIDANGQITALGVPANLNTKLQYYAGQVGALGRSLTVIGRDPITQTDKIIYDINIRRAPYLASSQVLISELPVRLNDLATHPTLGVIYTYDSKNKRLANLGGSLVSTFNHPSTSEYLSALYFDKAGNLYAYGNSSRESGGEQHFLVNRHSGKMQELGKGFPGRESDGCSCPYSLDFGMKITPTQVLPCSEITIEYTFFNATGANWQDLVFRDSFPAGVTIKAIEKNSANLSTVIGGVGTSVFRLINMNLILESNTIRLRAWVDDLPPGKYSAQAALQFLPALYGEPLISDNLLSIQARDSAFFNVVEPKSLKLNSKLRFSCNGDTAYIEAPFEALSYQWSDGSTGKTLVTTRNGRYSLLAKTPCLDYVDTIEIGERPAALQTNIQSPDRLESGDQVSLTYAGTRKGPFTANWSASEGLELSCKNCTSPALSARSSGTVYLQLRDAQGCIALDSAFVEVIPVRKVYIPNAFSPNGDQLNDQFYVQGRDGGQIVQWHIKDRWGNLVFEKKDLALNDPSQGWDGTFRGQRCAAGIFLYELEIEFPDGARKQFKGEVKLLR